MTVEFNILGDVQVWVDGRSLSLGHAQQQAVLVALLIDAPGPLPAQQLAVRIWGDRPPQRALNTLYTYVSRLRQVLAEVTDVQITWQRGGYRVLTEPASVDVQRFQRLVAQARASDDDAQAQALFERALNLWRGDAFANLDSAWLNSARTSLERERFAAVLDYTDVRLRRGQHGLLLAELTDRADAFPWDERVSGQLILALQRCGRTGDALTQYQLTRRRLADELGVDPGAELQRLHRQILNQDPAMSMPENAPAPVSPAGVVPRQLPAPPSMFSGRAGALRRLAQAVPTAGGQRMGLWVIDGMGGVGKTWLALRWAHEQVESFPDGQLYLNLRGFGPSGTAVDPAEAVRGFLDALGVSTADIPLGLDAQLGLYRSLLVGKRVLVVLDNARDVAQVRPLLPGSVGCVVVVTSRNRLSGLVTSDGARSLSLGLLSTDESRSLLADRLGAAAVAAEPAAVDEIIGRCARLPLALAIAAARAAARPEFPLEVLADELRRAAGGLDAFVDSDAASDARTVFSWSYRALSSEAALVFRMAALHPGPDLTAPAAASLAGLPVEQTGRLLAELTSSHLLTEYRPGRWTCHGLLRVYATEQGRTLDSEPRRTAALHRLLDHYLHTAHGGARHLQAFLIPLELPPPRAGAVVTATVDAAAALAWFAAEHDNLLAGVQLAVGARFDTHTWQLGWAMTTYLLRRGHWDDQAAVQNAGLQAARRLGDVVGEAHARHGLALGYSYSGRFSEARPYLEQALELFERAGDANNTARVHGSLTWLAERENRPQDALGHALRGLDLLRATDHRAGLAIALGAVGWCHTQLDDHKEAIDYLREALGLSQELGKPDTEASIWDSLGYCHRGLLEYPDAIDCYQRSIDMYREIGDRYNEADSLINLGDTHLAAGHPAEDVRRTWEQARLILDQLDHPDLGRRVRDRLDNLQSPVALANGR